MTVQEAKEVLNNIWDFTDAQDEEKADVVDDAIIEAIECMEEVEQYRALGTPKEIKIREVSSAQLGKAYLSNLTELREYQSLGTVEELKEAREKQVAKKEGVIMAIDEKKLIEELQGFSNSNEMIEYTTAYDVVQDCIGIVENQPKTDWIPCEERLPEEATSYLVTEEVIVCSQKQYVVDIRLFGTENEWLCPTNRKIIAWQPLPAPYKKEGAE